MHVTKPHKTEKLRRTIAFGKLQHKSITDFPQAKKPRDGKRKTTDWCIA